MRYICQRLLEDVTSCNPTTAILPFGETEYKRLLKFSKKFPTIPIPIKSEVRLIRQQWDDTTHTIISEGSAGLLLIKPTLFSVAKLMMTAYYKYDHDIPYLHAKWLDNVLDEVCPKPRYELKPDKQIKRTKSSHTDTSYCYTYITVLSCILFLYLIIKYIRGFIYFFLKNIPNI